MLGTSVTLVLLVGLGLYAVAIPLALAGPGAAPSVVTGPPQG
jgi:hypothetical protein